ncbi:hypothetical protein ACU686_29050 [Yinghuangia aomiensis]
MSGLVSIFRSSALEAVERGRVGGVREDVGEAQVVVVGRAWREH